MLGIHRLQKAFDSVEHISVVEALNSVGIHPKIVRLLSKIYLESRAKVKTEIESETFRIRRGVRQGDLITPKLFTCVLEAVFRDLSWNDMGYTSTAEGSQTSDLQMTSSYSLTRRQNWKEC
jgi:hypothetical protein